MMRLLIVGNSSVGKTCLLRRFSEGAFSESFIPTVGIDFAVKNLKIDNKIIKVQIFDTAGQERFKSIISSYFRNADGKNKYIYIYINKTQTKRYSSSFRRVGQAVVRGYRGILAPRHKDQQSRVRKIDFGWKQM